jgi:hypothetical protein
MGTARRNIDELEVKFNKEDDALSHLKFRSAGTKVGHFVAGASAQALPQADIDAKLVIEFGATDSFYINANLTSSEMQNIAQVVQALHHVDQASVSVTPSSEESVGFEFMVAAASFGDCG